MSETTSLFDLLSRYSQLELQLEELRIAIAGHPHRPEALRILEAATSRPVAQMTALGPAPAPAPAALSRPAAAPPPRGRQLPCPEPGSQKALVLEALKSGPMTPAELTERTGVGTSIHAVCSKLASMGLITRDADGRRRLVEVAA